MKIKGIKGIFFDLYGTLLIYNDMDSAWEEWLTSFHKSFTDYGLKMPIDNFAKNCDNFFTKSEPSPSVRDLTVYEHRIYNLGLDMGLDLRKEQLRKTAIMTINAWEQFVQLDPDAIPVLNALKSSKTLALITNYDHPPHIYTSLSNLNLLGLFDSIVISGEVGVKKPNPQIFSVAFQQTKLKPNEVIYIGDMLEDVKAAHNANVLPILIQREKSTKSNQIFDYYTNNTSIFQENQKIFISNVERISNLRELVEIYT